MINLSQSPGPAHQEPQRTCVVCGLKGSKKSLIRFTANHGVISVDKGQINGGRGCYCCPSDQCLAGLRKKVKRMNRALRVEGCALRTDELSVASG
ncbi:MAG: YlxR family protein [Thermodesulfobacteriota bacterium]